MKKVLARHKWLINCTINEMIDVETGKRYFVAKVCGWSGFYFSYSLSTEEVICQVRTIREKIESGDDKIFNDPIYSKENVHKI